jgi:hypothetical protein
LRVLRIAASVVHALLFTMPHMSLNHCIGQLTLQCARTLFAQDDVGFEGAATCSARAG